MLSIKVRLELGIVKKVLKFSAQQTINVMGYAFRIALLSSPGGYAVTRAPIFLSLPDSYIRQISAASVSGSSGGSG